MCVSGSKAPCSTSSLMIYPVCVILSPWVLTLLYSAPTALRPSLRNVNFSISGERSRAAPGDRVVVMGVCVRCGTC